MVTDQLVINRGISDPSITTSPDFLCYRTIYKQMLGSFNMHPYHVSSYEE